MQSKISSFSRPLSGRERKRSQEMARYIIDFRHSKGLSKREMAEQLRISDELLERIEMGLVRNAGIDFVLMRMEWVQRDRIQIPC